MRRSIFIAIIFAVGLVIAPTRDARAQDDEPRWEVGGLFSVLNVDNGSASITSILPCGAPVCPLVTTTAEHRATEAGFGARLGYGLNRHVTLEAEGNFFPRERGVLAGEFTGGRKFQGLFGVKAGRRFEGFGVFAKARPGFVHFASGDLEGSGGCIAIFPPPTNCFAVEGRGRTDFAFDIGGVLEVYPSARTLLRIDVGDTVLRSGEHNVPVLRQPTPVLVAVPARTTHNFQGGVGFGFRF